MVVRTPIYPNDKPCNNRDLHKYSPYLVKGVIDTDWWNSLTSYCQKLIQSRLNYQYELEPVSVPHDFEFDNKEKFLTTIYKSYIDSFDYHVWIGTNPVVQTPNDVNMVCIPSDLKELFVTLYDTQKSWRYYQDHPSLSKFYSRLTDLVTEGEYFIRMSSTSGKNEEAITSFNDVDDILDHITTVKLFIDQEYKRTKDSYLIIMPWNNNLHARCEFRLFVVNGKLTGVSQQYCHEMYNYNTEELEAYEEVFSNISWLDSVPYSAFVADVYIDEEQCRLIELNPFGAHCGAGSLLFNWIDDYDLLYGLTNQPPQFRYLSIINI